MKIHNRLALILLTAGLAACGSDLGGGSNGENISATSPVITANPITAPTAANQAAVGFRVIFPESAEVTKSALNPARSKVSISASGVCGTAVLDLTPSSNSGTMTLGTGQCSFVATVYDSFNAKIESATTNGTITAGANTVFLTFLGGPWLFVDPSTNDKLPLTLVGSEVLTGLRFSQDATGNVLTRWFGVDKTGNGPTGDDLMGGVVTNIPQLRVTGTFTGGTSAGANLVRLVGGTSNLTDWNSNFAAGQRVIQILGVNPNALYPKTFNPSTYKDYFTSKVTDGTTIDGNIAEFTVDAITAGTPYGTCSAVAAKAAQSAALTTALNAVSKAQTLITGTVTVSWTECVNNQNQDVTHTYSNVTIHPFRAKSVFADPAGALQVEFNSALGNYKSALSTEDPIKGLDLILLRKAASQFVAAVNLAADTDLSNTADTARFFGAVSRLVSLGIDSASDGVTDGLNDFNDVLDALGVPTDSLTRNWSNTSMAPPENCALTFPYDCTPNLPTNSPTSGQILTLLDTKLNTQLDLAIADLGKISAGFSYTFTDPSGTITNFDYGDVLALTAFAHGVKAEMAIDMAYDLNLDIDATINGSGPASVQAFLSANPNLGKLDATRYVTELAQAKTDLQTAMTTMQSAITVIEAEGTGIEQDSEFISFYNAYMDCNNYNPITGLYECKVVNRTADEIAGTRDAITKVLAGLNGPVTVDDRGTTVTTDDTIIDPSKFFAGINFRALLPGFTGDVPNGLFTDGTMGGVLVQGITLNEDIDGNGKPDILERPNFYAGLISGKSYAIDMWFGTGGSYQNISFGTGTTTGTVSNIWQYNNYNAYPPIYLSGTATGTWQILADGTLQINYTDGALPPNVTGMNAILDYYPDAMQPGFNAKVTLFNIGVPTMTTYSFWMIPQQPL